MQKANLIIEDVLRSLAFLHSRGMWAGASALHLESILIVSSTSGPQPLLSIPRSSEEGSKVDFKAAAMLLKEVWTTFGDVEPMKERLLKRMMSDDPPSMSNVLADIVFWTRREKLEFILCVSDILELKQKKHMDAIENVSTDIFNES